VTHAAAIPFHVVTGFLGAGKTTLINRLLRSSDLAGALVMVNEWGEIGLDHLLYERLSGDAILINSGCVCCALRGDLVDTLRDVLSRRDAGATPPFGRIVLETTGLAEPAPILQALIQDPHLASRLAHAGVTTLIDAVNGRSTLASHLENARQVALADRLVVAKSDLLPPLERAGRLADLSAALRLLNPLAPIVDGAAAEFGPSEFLAEAVGPFPGEETSRAVHSSAIRAFSFREPKPVEPEAFAQFLSAVASFLGPRLLRLKGIFALADRPDTPILVDGVQHVFHPPRILAGWPDADRASRAVLIVENISVRDVEHLWAALTRAPRIDAPDLAAFADNPLAPRAGGLLAR
jgi:G3E family GTPase